MSKVLFMNFPAYGHVNPTLGLVDELVKRGEEVYYFCTDEFKESIEKTGAKFISYGERMSALKNANRKGRKDKSHGKIIIKCIDIAEHEVEDILNKIKGIKFDYAIYDSMFCAGNIIAQILKIPSISSLAVFATIKEVMKMQYSPVTEIEIENDPTIFKAHNEANDRIEKKYSVNMPKISQIMSCRGDLNIAYTAKEFVANMEYYDDSFKFIGPPIYNRHENLDFPFEKLENKKVIYISLGTVFNNTNSDLYKIFFEAFGDSDAVVVMSAYNIDMSNFNIPKNFIVRNYVPQTEILKYADAAVTHAGMNSTSDLIYNKVPFVAIPIGADQLYMAARAKELGTAIVLNKDKLTAKELRESVEKVMADASYINNIEKVKEFFREAGGYKRGVDEIFKLKIEKGIKDYACEY
ncbi:macrolide family glycosyltransferase [Clostridium felsineum]|uniref:Demethyllactenocin mycarosyltransferase n=1 Tax=Clostridium felsineum TaxID=36839 RepID=A0A1S8M7V1_9CLOT|nr:macrolide family glycosyltransferase [Clostridium felsineum]URZ07728.1 Demethyllactenocin mycarosyltransferase [Clostridium felsineum]URZ12759.1 Demethyllactenocin mycarosyltransferase [Clostridium felsineum]